jgi:hypothetical protein
MQIEDKDHLRLRQENMKEATIVDLAQERVKE